MSKDKRFEDILRERLYGYELSPPMHLWPAVAAARKKRKGGVKWLAAGVSAVALGLCMWWFAFRQTTPGNAPMGAFPIVLHAVPKPLPEVALSPMMPVADESPALHLVKASNARRGAAPVEGGRPQLPEGAALPSDASLRPGAQFDQLLSSRQAKTLSRLPVGRRPLLLPRRKLQHNDCPGEFGKRLHVGLFAGGWAGPWMGFGTLQPRADDAQLDAYAQARRQTERRRVGYGAGLHLVLRTNKGWALRAGLDWTEMRERFFFKQENVERVIVVTRYDDQGNVVGADTTIEIGTLVRQTTNRLQMVNVPFGIGWHQTYRHWSWSVYAGAVWNLGLWASGDLLSPELEPISLRGGDAQQLEVFRTRVGVGSVLSASVQWMPVAGLQVFAEPTVRRWSRSFTVESYPLAQHYSEAGLRLGVRWQW